MSDGITPGGRSGRRNRRLMSWAAIIAVIGLAGVMMLVARQPSVAPAPSGLAALEPDLPPETVDGHIDLADLQHDSRDDLYRTPVGPVTAGSNVTLRLRATAGDLSRAQVLVHDALTDSKAVVEMAVAATDRTAGEHGYDYWQATIDTGATPTILEYQFVARDGDAVRYLSDDAAADGGTGNLYGSAPEAGGWQITAYDPKFSTPAWTHGAVVYQIFPDRFFDGDPSNNPDPAATPGPGGLQYRYGDVYGNPVMPMSWNERPEGYCRAYQGVACSQAPLGRDFFGGDLAGITAKLDDLADLGVTAIYLNPIFAAPSNHRYDTSDYLVVDPDLGSQADFDALVKGLRARGMRLILDGVFNHVSSDSPWFDRARRFEATGACESPTSPYRSWFTFRRPAGNEPAPCAATDSTTGDTYYVGWFGFDTIPELQEVPAVDELINGDQGVVRHWLELGSSGWRLDVMDNLSDAFVRSIRDATKSADPDALVLGEQWGDSTRWLLGNEADSVMNYRFRRAVIGLVNGPTPDLDGAIDGLSPSQFAAQMEAVLEDYPPAAVDALLNLVDSHDTTRILWTLTPGAENDAAKSEPGALAAGKAKLREVATIQLTWPGMAGLYYGDEVGLSGQDDPDDRRPYPWASKDDDLRGFYQKLAKLRAGHEALRTGSLRFLLADDDLDAIAYARTSASEVALTVLNLADAPQSIVVDVASLIPNGAVLTDGLGGAGATVADGRVSVDVAAGGAVVLLTAPGLDLEPPAEPQGLAAPDVGRAVGLSWSAVDGAAGYRVFRSLVSGGGYAPVGEVSAMAFADASVRPGTAYHYRVAALDQAGNVSAPSAEVVAVPHVTIAEARLDVDAAISQPVSAVAGAPVRVVIGAPGVTDPPGAAVGLRVQAGFGPTESDPNGLDWTWMDMHFDADTSGADRYAGDVRPESPGSYLVAARVSTTAGASWTLVDRDGLGNGFQVGAAAQLTALAPTDAEPPPVPAAPEIAAVSGSSVTIRWAAVGAADLFRYLVWRAPAEAGEFALLGSTVTPVFTDESVQPGAGYRYVVVAQDTAFNSSATSPETLVAAMRREVQVTFTVTLPKATPPSDTIFIAGDFQGWNPGATAMSRVDDVTWTITLAFEDGAQPQYKYTRGTWDAVEKDSGCGEIPNRTTTVDFGTGGAQAVADIVAKWRDIDHCG